MRFDNSIPIDYVIVLPEKFNTDPNELLRIPQVGESENDFSKLNPEVCFKGLSRAICTFEDFITDVNNQTEPPHESIHELFKDIEKHLFPLDFAYNLFITMVALEGSKYNYPELAQLRQRYEDVRNRKSGGQFKNLLQRLAFAGRDNLSSTHIKMLKFYNIRTRRRQGVQPYNDNTLVALEGNLKDDMKQFVYNLHESNKLFSHTVDDPDILAAVAPEFDSCQDLHHRERTPLQVGTSTYRRFMRLCPDRFVRKMLWQTLNKRCSPKATPKYNNLPVLDNIRVIRRKLSDMIGYRSYLELKLEGTMASSRHRVLESLDGIERENSPKLAQRLQELYEYAADNSFPDSSSLGLREYDLDFLLNKYMHDILIGVGESQLKNFFPLKNVMQGMRKYLETYFSIEFKIETENDDKFWSKDLQFIELFREGQPLGVIAYSPYKKPRGRGDLYYSRLRSRVQGAGHFPARFIGASFNRDNSEGQAYLSVPEVMKLFSCFTTVIQEFMYNYPYYELNSFGGLEADVEPLLRNLCEAHLLTDHRILQSCSIREGSKPIDSELASRIVKAYVYSRPFMTWFELYIAHLDSDAYATLTSTKNLVQELYKRYSPFPRDPDNYDYCCMREIFVGTDGGLMYSGLWSRQLANFCLSRVQEKSGNLNVEETKTLYKNIIELLFTGHDIPVDEKLTSLLGQRFEPSKLGLGVL